MYIKIEVLIETAFEYEKDVLEIATKQALESECGFQILDVKSGEVPNGTTL